MACILGGGGGGCFQNCPELLGGKPIWAYRAPPTRAPEKATLGLLLLVPGALLTHDTKEMPHWVVWELLSEGLQALASTQHIVGTQ